MTEPTRTCDDRCHLEETRVTKQPETPEVRPAAADAMAAVDTVGTVDPVDAVKPLVRRRSGRVVAGVAGGVADHLSVPVLWVRAVLTILAGLGGAGVLAYGLLWVFVPQARGRPGSDPIEITPRERQQALGLVAIGIGLAVAAGALNGTAGAWITGPLGVALVGAAVVWREADESQRRRLRSGAGSVFGAGPVGLVRVLAGVVLVVCGIAIFLLGSIDLGQVQFALLAVVATLVGVGVITVPWWLRMMRDLGEERRARIRTQEREDIAAHLHDSVLQTLALIQKQADAPREVRRLARRQERELRTWLYDEKGHGRTSAEVQSTDEEPTTLASALAAAAAEVEDTYAVSVQSVVVGDCPLDGPLTAVVQAAREAMVNAAKHAGVGEVSLYVEVEPDVVHVFVRDRGAGFDPDSVSTDRHGLANSIQGRMERNGGTVRLRTAPGEGTEVQLEMPCSTVTSTVPKEVSA
jgi:signal transduction histidine kinase/phage shock protein PspC (stress-responsive transcriptional regulator)